MWKSNVNFFSYYFFEQRAFKHIFAFVLMQMCACLKEHMRVDFCALYIVCLGSTVSWNRQDCNRQSMQRVQNTWLIGTGLRKCSDINVVVQTATCFYSGCKKQQNVLRYWRKNQRLPFQKLFILPLSWVTFLLVTVLWIVWICDCCFFADFLVVTVLLVKTTRLNHSKRFGVFP